MVALELFCGKGFDTSVIWSAISLPIKSPVPSAAFWIGLFEVVLLHLLETVYSDQEVSGDIYHLSFHQCFCSYFSKRQKSIAFYKYSIDRLNWIVLHLLDCTF